MRKYTGEPYLVHPFAVAGLVASVTSDEEMLAAAILHDVVEDSHITAKTIHHILGKRVGDLVVDLTDVSTLADGNRALRKKLDRERLFEASWDAKTIKLADMIDNTKSILAHDPKFAKIYMAEKKLLLSVIGDGDKALFDLACATVDNYYKEEDLT